MANQIEPTNIDPTQFVANTSRYTKSSVIYWGEKKVLTFNTYRRKPYVPNASDKFLVIKKGWEFRPDLIAKRAYGVNLVSYWWKIMEANNIFDVYDLKAGITLRIPSIV